MVVLVGGAVSYERSTPVKLQPVTLHQVCLGPRPLLASQCITPLCREAGPPNPHDDKVDSDLHQVCLGPRPLLASQCITILLHAIDVATLGVTSATEL